tara:strand:+ start:1507 stop:2115 length:609 start_codon:yes stop_codon:yes gene_type:complete
LSGRERMYLDCDEVSYLAVFSFGAVQKVGELTGLLTYLESRQPKVVVEIGVDSGGVSWALTKLTSVKKVIGIDKPDAYWGTGQNLANVKYIIQNSSNKYQFLSADSHAEKCYTQLVGTYLEPGEKIDFLFIDGDHSYEGVKQDFEMYSPLVAEGGSIAFHDICTETPRCQVKRFWDEIKDTKSYGAIISEPPTMGGIGIMQW